MKQVLTVGILLLATSISSLVYAEEFEPFANEEDSIAIGELTIENRTDRISIYGETDITKDKKGLEKALQFQNIINSTILILKSSNLPDNIKILPAETTKNPFKVSYRKKGGPGKQKTYKRNHFS